MERLHPDAQATLLLLSPLGNSGAKPLTHAEYNRLAKELLKRELRPSDLIRGPFDGYVVAADRLEALMARGTALALTLERWTQAGIRVITRVDPHYPAALRTKLRASASPLLFYSGEIELLDGKAVCVVGSREPTKAGLDFARRLGEACAQQGFTVVSGDARGVDRESMTAALDAGGRAVGVLAEALGSAVLVRRNRDPILDGRLLLVSPQDPDARFTVARAMDRNRYLYAMADAAMVVDSDVKGGTWSGAVENRKYDWTPAFVRIGTQNGPGNSKLAEMGLIPIQDTGAPIIVHDLIEQARTQAAERSSAQLSLDDALRPAARAPTFDGKATDAAELFAMFLAKLKCLLTSSPRTEVEIVDHFQLDPRQVQAWLYVAQHGYGLTRDGDRLCWSSDDRAA